MATYIKTGSGALGTLSNVRTKTGKGVSTFVGSGVKVKIGSGTTYTKAGHGISVFTGTASHFVGGPDVGPPMAGPATIKPAIAFPTISGISLPSVPAPDTSSTDAVFQMTVTDYTPPGGKTGINTVVTIPIVNGDTMYGGVALMDSAQELRKATVSGFFDTPTTASSTWQLPNVVVTSTGAHITYADYIILCNEGRATVPWKRIDPLWFRDPHGRVYTNPRVLDFSASYTEGVPGRVNFQLTLVI